MSDKESDSDNFSRLVVLSDGTYDSLGGGRIIELKDGYNAGNPFMDLRMVDSSYVIQDVSLNDLFDCWKKFGKQFKEERGE